MKRINHFRLDTDDITYTTVPVGNQWSYIVIVYIRIHFASFNVGVHA